MKNLFELEKDRLAWSLETFPEASPISSLLKLESEIQEVILELGFETQSANLSEEYADCLMCLFDSAGRAGITPEMITQAFAKKLEKNKARKWVKNPDNSYSHVK